MIRCLVWKANQRPFRLRPIPALEVVSHSSVSSPRELELLADGYAERAYSFWAYFRSHLGFVLAMAALMAVVAGVLAVTGSNVSVIVLVTVCEAHICRIVLDAGFLRDRKFYQQLDLFCNSPENARYLSSILDEPRTLEGSIAYRALCRCRARLASDELAARLSLT